MVCIMYVYVFVCIYVYFLGLYVRQEEVKSLDDVSLFSVLPTSGSFLVDLSGELVLVRTTHVWLIGVYMCVCCLWRCVGRGMQMWCYPIHWRRARTWCITRWVGV